MSAQPIKKDALFSTLPVLEHKGLLAAIQAERKIKTNTIIVLDDDPTGTQTVHDVPVLTSWETEVLVSEFQKETAVFFILTNSRSLTEEEAKELAYSIGHNISKAALETGTPFWVISRSDSTLRGHYPSEVSSLEEGLNWKNSIQFIIPAFFDGGRYTIDDIHYVQQGDSLIPAAQTPYAMDKVFGYRNSNLKDWVLEKNNGTKATRKIASISIDQLRTKSLSNLIEHLNSMQEGTVCILNAADDDDLHFFSLAILRSNVQPIFRTAASFVASIAGLKKQALLAGSSISNKSQHGGLIVVGSYVPTTSQQLDHLLSNRIEIEALEISVDGILSAANQQVLREEYSNKINDLIRDGRTVVLYTSRNLVSVASEKENQEMGKKISHFLTQIVGHLDVCPAYILTKGGITSSDIATKSLGIKRAIVKGQIINGVPVWELGEETKFPQSHQIIFPGNVGNENSLTKIVEKLTVLN